MNAIARDALQQLLAGNDSILTGFGLERWTTAGPVVRPGIFKWEERLAVTGACELSLASLRSIADVSSEDIGDYATTVSQPEMRRLIELVAATELDALPPFRIEPTDLSVRISLVIGGAYVESFIGMRNPAALNPVRPLLQQLDKLADAVRQHPRQALELRVALPTAHKVGEVQLPVTLMFVNPGTMGFWITNPVSLPNTDSIDHCRLLYGSIPDATPGTTPLPIEMRLAEFVAQNRDDRPFIWIPAGTEVPISFTASVSFDSPGTYVVRAVYSSYSGSDSVGGQRRLRGCVFSNEILPTIA